MKWDDDSYRDLKFEILDLLIEKLKPIDAKKITHEMATDGIDNLFKDLLKKSKETSDG